jgi:N-acetylmuramoyl-L-alanine amidase
LPVKLKISSFHAPYSRAFRAFLFICSLAAAAQLAAAQQAPSAPQARFVVVLDAAHGGDETGGRLTDGQFEKTFTLALTTRLRSLLVARGIEVVTTRESDAVVEPEKRAEIANHAVAQACLSLHASEAGSGVHLFVSSLAPAQPVRFPAWKTAQGAWLARSLKLAGVVNSALLQAGMSTTLVRTTLPVVDSMTCPAAAVEIAPERSALHETTAGLGDPDYQARVAAALAAALVEWRTEAHQP